MDKYYLKFFIKCTVSFFIFMCSGTRRCRGDREASRRRNQQYKTKDVSGKTQKDTGVDIPERPGE